jgi:5-methylcytosine-specific restriction endonuclease McrA
MELNDNKIALIAGQQGKCYVTGNARHIGNMECHHKKPKHQGGTDEYNNLVWLEYNIHKLVHSTEQDTINKYLSLVRINEKGLKLVNSLRKLVGNSVI